MFRFWGPGADISSSKWIADAARHVNTAFDPMVLLVYLPHLDYGLQKFGPDSPVMAAERAARDAAAAALREDRVAEGARRATHNLLPGPAGQDSAILDSAMCEVSVQSTEEIYQDRGDA